MGPAYAAVGGACWLPATLGGLGGASSASLNPGIEMGVELLEIVQQPGTG